MTVQLTFVLVPRLSLIYFLKLNKLEYSKLKRKLLQRCWTNQKMERTQEKVKRSTEANSFGHPRIS